MALSVHQLKSYSGSKHRRKRVGRGNASGHGTFSCRGSKGQKARTGGKNRLKQKGMRHLLLSTPKLRGFKSPYTKSPIINLNLLEKNFQDGESISPKILLEKGLIDTISQGVKILADGQLTKKLEIAGCQVSASAKEKIEKVGGTIKF